MIENEISVNLSLELVERGFTYIGTNDLGKVDSICQECGHPIRYENIYQDEQGNEYIYGSECMFKLYILLYWKDEIKGEDVENKQLQRAGKWLWIIHRDGYKKLVEKIPKPSDFDSNFKLLADELKNIVMSIRNKIKKEEKDERERELNKEIVNRESKKIISWLNSEKINFNSCNDWEKDFISSIYAKRIRFSLSLSDKQRVVLEKIRERRPLKKPILDVAKVSVTKEGYDMLVNIVKKENLRFLSDFDKEFVRSVAKQIKEKKSISERQFNTINNINEKCKKYNIYTNKCVSSWLINKKFGLDSVGVIKTIKNSSEKALFCDVIVGDKVFYDVWIPLSQIKL